MIAILRAKNASMAVTRGVELADMGNICSAACAMQWRSGVMFRRTLLGTGCKALEVTLDSVGFEGIVQQLVSSIGDRCCVGAGTVVTLDEVSKPGSEPMGNSRGVRSGTPPSDTKSPCSYAAPLWLHLVQLCRAAKAGCRFALSPVRPNAGFDFVAECHKRGMLAVPAAYSPQVAFESGAQRGPGVCCLIVALPLTLSLCTCLLLWHCRRCTSVRKLVLGL